MHIKRQRKHQQSPYFQVRTRFWQTEEEEVGSET